MVENSDSHFIEEKLLEDYPIPITSENTEIILNQMRKNICKIYLNDGTKASGFFCKIPFPDNGHLLPVLFTNNHVIDKSNLTKSSKIVLSINDDKVKKTIKINNRKVYTNKEDDVTIIEILENNDGITEFLELDNDIFEDEFNSMNIKKSIYILHYPNCGKSSVSYGIIKNLQNSDVSHLCSTEKGSSGSPILNLTNNKVIGIHRGSFDNFKFNKGSILSNSIKLFKEKYSSVQKKQPKEKFTLINNVEPDFNPEYNNNSTIKKYGDKVLKSCLFLEGFQIYRVKDNRLVGALEGPPKTLYENGFFIFEMIFQYNFPFNPPKFIFKTKIFHPNIGKNGIVSVDVLQDQWSPSLYPFEKTIFSVQSLLDDPNPDDFLNEEAAKLLKENKKKYEITVKNYTSQYANYVIFKNELQNLNIKIKTIDKK